MPAAMPVPVSCWPMATAPVVIADTVRVVPLIAPVNAAAVCVVAASAAWIAAAAAEKLYAVARLIEAAAHVNPSTTADSEPDSACSCESVIAASEPPRK